MPFEFILLAALVLPVVLITFLRINAVMVFLSLCLGQVLVAYVAKDPASFIAFIAPHSGTSLTTAVELGILFAPVVLTCAMTIKGVHGHLRTILNILPAAGAVLFSVLLAVPLLTPGLRGTIEAEPLWQQVERLQPVIVGVTAIASMFFLWTERKHAGE